MSTYYDFMVEAKYKDKWYNIDLHTKDFDGKHLHTLQGYWIGGDSVYFPLDHQNRSSMRHRSGFPIGQQSLRISRNS